MPKDAWNTLDYHEKASVPDVSYRQSGLMLACITGVIYTFLLIKGKHQPYLLACSLIVAVLALLEAWPLRKTIDLFINLGNFMHRFSNPLVFAIIYFVAVIPTALVVRLLGKDILDIRYNSNINSYWKQHDLGKPRTDSFLKQY